MAVTKKTSATSEQALVMATSNFKKSVAELKSGVEVLSALEEKVEELQATIASKEEDIKSLDTQFAEKKRQAEVTFELDLKANQNNKVETILTAQGKVAIEKTNLNQIQKSYQDLQNEFDKKLSEATNQAYTKANAEFKTKVELFEAQMNTKEAENNAKILVLEQQNKFLADQVSTWKSALDAEREAGIKRAQAQGSVNLTVPTANK